jgi:hypothetical protein
MLRIKIRLLSQIYHFQLLYLFIYLLSLLLVTRDVTHKNMFDFSNLSFPITIFVYLLSLLLVTRDVTHKNTLAFSNLSFPIIIFLSGKSFSSLFC